MLIYSLLNMFLLYLSVENLHFTNNIAAGREERPLTSVVIILLENLNCVNSCQILFIFKTLFKFSKAQTATSTLSFMIWDFVKLFCFLSLMLLFAIFRSWTTASLLSKSIYIAVNFLFFFLIFFYFKYLDNTKSTTSKGKLQKLSVYRIQLEGRAERSSIFFSLVTSPNVRISLKTWSQNSSLL